MIVSVMSIVFSKYVQHVHYESYKMQWLYIHFNIGSKMNCKLLTTSYTINIVIT